MVWRALNSRFRTEWINDPVLKAHYQSLAKTQALVTGVSDHKAKVEKSGTLSTKGVAESVREFAAKSVVPELRRAHYRLERTAKALDERRSRLGVPAIDRSDLVGAMIRQETRVYLRTVDVATRVELLLSAKPEVIAAVYEAPDFLSGVDKIDAETRQRIERERIETENPKIVAQIDNEREAVAIAATAIEVGINQIRLDTGFGSDERGFSAWMTEASAEVEKEVAARKITSSPAEAANVMAQFRLLSSADKERVVNDAFDEVLGHSKAAA